MIVTPLQIPDVLLITPKRHGDARGFFAETYNQRSFADAGIRLNWVQDNHSMSAAKGVVRALHYQLPPMAQDKIVRVIRGSILDVAVDIRKNSPTFGQHVKAVLSAENFQMMLVPVGFAHGFATLEPNTEVLYKVTSLYSPTHERGIRWNDPALNIDWQIPQDQATLNARDANHPPLAQATDLF